MSFTCFGPNQVLVLESSCQTETSILACRTEFLFLALPDTVADDAELLYEYEQPEPPSAEHLAKIRAEAGSDEALMALLDTHEALPEGQQKWLVGWEDHIQNLPPDPIQVGLIKSIY